MRYYRLLILLVAVAAASGGGWRGGAEDGGSVSSAAKTWERAVKIDRAETILRERIGRRPTHTVGTLIATMLDFYREVRFKVRGFKEGGDGLLLQWGTYDWGQGRHFELDLTRQFFVEGEDEPFQLNLTMRFAPTATLSSLGRSDRWCLSLDDMDEFEPFIRSSSPYEALASLEPDSLEIRFEQV